MTYHFECIEFLLDLLRKEGCETIARSNLPTTIIVGTRPSVMELDPRAKANRPHASIRRIRLALRIRARGEVVTVDDRC